jgi:hypothetical protein
MTFSAAIAAAKALSYELKYFDVRLGVNLGTSQIYKIT